MSFSPTAARKWQITNSPAKLASHSIFTIFSFNLFFFFAKNLTNANHWIVDILRSAPKKTWWSFLPSHSAYTPSKYLADDNLLKLNTQTTSWLTQTLNSLNCPRPSTQHQNVIIRTTEGNSISLIIFGRNAQIMYSKHKHLLTSPFTPFSVCVTPVWNTMCFHHSFVYIYFFVSLSTK